MKRQDIHQKYIQHLATILILPVFSVLLVTCTPENVSMRRNDTDAITRMPYRWKSSISNRPLGSSLYKGFTIPDKGVLYIGKAKATEPFRDSFLGVKDFDSGRDGWKWAGFFNNRLNRTLEDHLAIINNKIIIHDLESSYLIDALTGTELWKQNRLGSVSSVTGVENVFFFAAQVPGSDESKKQEYMAYWGDLTTGKIQPLVKPPYNGEYAKFRGDYLPFGFMLEQKALKIQEDIMLIMPYEEMGPDATFTPLRSFFGLYNVTQQKWVYDRAPLSFPEEGSSQSVMPQVVGDKVYLTSLATVGCFDLMTGKRIWQKRVTDVNTGIFDMLVAEDRVVVNVHNAEMHCLDAATGNLYWTQKSSGISSDMYYQDGVIYWIPSKNLRAVDIQTGKLLWDLPSMDKESDSSWWGFVTGTPAQGGEKGRIYATSDLYMYCFDAAK